MSLQRPPRLSLNPELSLEAKLLAKLEEMDEKINTVISRQREQTQMLVGTADGPIELPHGRLVQLETRVAGHDGRLDNLEKSELRADAYWSGARFFGHVMAGLLGGGIAVLAEYFLIISRH